jgi:hypothetical protein
MLLKRLGKLIPIDSFFKGTRNYGFHYYMEQCPLKGMARSLKVSLPGYVLTNLRSLRFRFRVNHATELISAS